MPEPFTIPTEAELDQFAAILQQDERLFVRDSQRLIASLRLLLAEHRAAVSMDLDGVPLYQKPGVTIRWERAVKAVEAAMPKEPK